MPDTAGSSCSSASVRARSGAPGVSGGMGGTRRKLPVLTVASALVVASCVGGSGQTAGWRDLNLASAGLSEVQTAAAEPMAQNENALPSTADPPAGSPDSGSHPSDAAGAPVSELGAPLPNAVQDSGHGTSRGGRRVSLRPMDNVSADDLLDHWGHRPTALLSRLLSPAPDPGADVAGFEDLLEAARGVDGGDFVPGLEDDDNVAVLGQRRGVTYGRWSGGPADTLAIRFDLRHATREMREDASFRAALARAGKAWSWRIDDTWEKWERRAGESKGRLIGDYGFGGREIRVGPDGETSTGLIIHVTDVELSGNAGGVGGPGSVRLGDGWEPHTGAIALRQGPSRGGRRG